MKFYNISNTSAFLETVLACSGDVYYQDSDGNMQDLKQAARQFRACGCLALPRRLDRIDVQVQKDADFLRLYRYMMEACYAG